MKIMNIGLTALVLLSMSVTGCKNSKLSRQEKGAIIGVGAGAATGALIGKRSGNTAVGVIIGAAVGGSAGTLIGLYMDKQARELERKLEDAKVERIGEGIKITFDSGLLFALDSYTLSNETRKNIDSMADVIKEYNETAILIEGHTDNTGTGAYNQDLSENRAKSVFNYLVAKNVDKNRIRTVGYGESQPISANTTKSGQQLNRRVEVVITANKQLKAKARAEAAGVTN